MQREEDKKSPLLRPIFFKGIGRKILLWLIFFSLVPLLVSSTLSYKHNRDAITRGVMDHLSSVVTLKREAVRTFLTHGRSIAEGVVTGQKHLLEDIKKVSFFPEGSAEHIVSFRDLTALLIKKEKDNPDIDEMLILDPRGRILCSSDPSHIGEDYSGSRFFQMASSSATTISEFYPQGMKVPSLMVLTPVVDDDGRLVGYLALRLNLNSLHRIASDRTGMRMTGQTYIVNEIGLLVSPPPAGGGESMKVYRTSPGIEACLSGRDGKGVYKNYGGEDVVGAYRFIPEMKWAIISEITTKEAFEPIARMRNRTLILGIFILLAALFGAFIITHDIVEPLSVLVRASRRMAGGAFEEEIEVRSKDELGQLAMEFNSMAKSLKRYKEMLEDWNQRLTEEVKKRTEELKSSEERYLNLIESSIDAIMVTDLHGSITFFSRGAEVITGFKSEEMVGRKIYEFYPGGIEEARKLMHTLKMEGRIQNYELDFESKDRGVLKMNLSASLIRDKDGNLSGVLGIGKDVTELKALEKQLMHAERLATIGRMSSQVAHEIRNPLSSISLHAELLDEELRERGFLANEEIAGSMKAIHDEIKRLYEITEDYLQFARLPKPEFDTNDVNEILSDLIDFYEEELKSRDIRLNKKLYPDRLIALVDANQLRRALLNVLRNAAEASEPGGEITASTATANGRIEIVIEDRGQGITPEDMEKIFEPFYSTKEMGTGLGLPLTQQIVEEHHGSIECESEPGRGTRIRITLPHYSGRRSDRHES